MKTLGSAPMGAAYSPLTPTPPAAQARGKAAQAYSKADNDGDQDNGAGRRKPGSLNILV